MPVSTKNQERNLIQFSIAMGSIYTLVGVIWGDSHSIRYHSV